RDEVVARLPGLARDPGRDDEHVGALEVGPVGRPLDGRVVAEDGAVLLEVERLALREVLLRWDVEEEDVAELLVRAEPRELAADVACANESDLLAGGHGESSSPVLRVWGGPSLTQPRPAEES